MRFVAHHMYLPRNALAMVSAQADRRTRARLKVLDRGTLADPLMRGAGLRRGYAFGTGTHQRLYNELAKRLRAVHLNLSNSVWVGLPQAQREEMFKRMDAFKGVLDLLTNTHQLYKSAVKAGDPVVDVYGKKAEREQWMTDVLLWARDEAPLKEAAVWALSRAPRPSDANASRRASLAREIGKESRQADARSFLYDEPENRTAARVARRAARRLAA